MITRNVKVKVEPTITETAETIWDMDARDQLILLSCLDISFFRIPADGEDQLAHMFNALRQQLSPERQKHVKHFIKALHQYLVEEDNSEIEEE